MSYVCTISTGDPVIYITKTNIIIEPCHVPISIYLSIYLSIHRSIYLSIYLSPSLSRSHSRGDQKETIFKCQLDCNVRQIKHVNCKHLYTWNRHHRHTPLWQAVPVFRCFPSPTLERHGEAHDLLHQKLLRLVLQEKLVETLFYTAETMGLPLSCKVS